jgi:hypothetical protein
VHAELRHSTENHAFVRHRARVRALPELRYGHIIGTVELHDVLPPDPPASAGPWAFANQWLWLLRDPRPRPMRATVGLVGGSTGGPADNAESATGVGQPVGRSLELW